MQNVLLLFLLVIFFQCKDSDFHVRGVKINPIPQRKLLLGSIQNRDYKTPKSLAKDFRDLFSFELMQKGYSLVQVEQKSFERDLDMTSEKSSLPASLRKSAGEAAPLALQLDRLLDKQEIRTISHHESVDYFVQGVVSIQSNDKILDRKDYNYIFLNVYDAEGNLIGMLNSSFDEKILGESEQLRRVAYSLVQTFDKSMK